MDGEVNHGGHSMAWGSYWSKENGWGYKCCHSADKASRCLGEQGKQLNTVPKKQEKPKEISLKKRSRSNSSSSSNHKNKR